MPPLPSRANHKHLTANATQILGCPQMKKSEGARVSVQMPHDLRLFLEEQAQKNWSNMNTEAVRAIREMAAREAEKAAG
jgi:hypothetical protein